MSHDDFSVSHQHINKVVVNCKSFRYRLIKFNIKTTASLLHSTPSLSIGNDFTEKHFALHAVVVIFFLYSSLQHFIPHFLAHCLCFLHELHKKK